MAAATNITKLPEVLRSPSTIQYTQYRTRVKHQSPYFKPRFTFKVEDRQHTLQKLWQIKMTDPLMPPYPHGQNMSFPEANFGLYGGSTIQTGNKISKGRNKGKTVRHWFPNVRVETVMSEALGRELKLPITARVMRTIRKCGGLDEYVTGMKPARIKELGLLGWKLRWLVMTSPKYQARHEGEMVRYNLPKHYSLKGTFEDAWNDEAVRTEMVQQQDAVWEDLRKAAQRFETHVQSHWVDNGEKRPYIIPRLESLSRSSPSTLGLPVQLEEPIIVEPKYRHIRTFREGQSSDQRASLLAEELGRADEYAPNTSNTDHLPEKTKDQIDGLTRSMKAQDLGIDPAEEDPESIERRMEAIKEMLRNRMPEIEDELSRARAEREMHENAEVVIAQTAEDHAAKVDEQHVEQNVEQHLESIRGQMKNDTKIGARAKGKAAEQDGDGRPPSTQR